MAETFPYTFFGFAPGTTKAQVRRCLEDFCKGDNRITSISQAYRLEPGTGWDVPPGMLHAPGSLCTYEPQRGIRRLRHVPIAGRHFDRSRGVALERRSAEPPRGRRLADGRDRLGPEPRPEPPPEPLHGSSPGATVGADENGRIHRQLDLLQVRRLQRQGTDHPAGRAPSR